MLVTRATAGASAALPSRAVRIVRLSGAVLVTLFALFCVLLLVLRYVVLPQLPAHREALAAMLSERIGAPVAIDALTTGWDGWNPKLVVNGFRLTEHRATPDAKPGGTVLELPHVELVASWTSLPLLQLQLRTLLVERPKLAVRRDAAGRFHLAGIQFDPDAEPDADSPFTDWLLRQPEIVVRDALITWNDERRQAPQLVLDQVQFRLQNERVHHRFGLTGVPPAELASPLDLRGDVTGVSLANWQGATGNLYLRLDYADMAAWREWIPLPVQVQTGKGAVRMWFDFGGGVARHVTSDIELANVSLLVQPSLPPLQLLHLAGRMEWHQDDKTRRVEGKGVSFTAREGTTQAPMDFTWRAERAVDGTTTAGQFTFTHAELAPLATAATQLPLPAEWRAPLEERKPRGALAHGEYQWTGSTEAPTTWRASATLVDVGLDAAGGWPGATGLNGTLKASETGGALHLASAASVLHAPRVLRNPLRFDRLDGDVTWAQGASGMHAEARNVAVANADVEATLTADWQAAASGPGMLTLAAQVKRANVARLGTYLDGVIGNDARDWFNTRFTKGTASEGHVALAGNLADFPFTNGRAGSFTVNAQLAGIALTPDEHWPTFTDIDGTVAMDRLHLALDVTRGRVLDASITHATIDVPDVAHATVGVKLDVAANMNTFLDFIAQSPVAGWIDHAVDDARATGPAKLAVQVTLPLASNDKPHATGELAFAGGDLQLPGAPALSAVNGSLRFNERGIVGGELDATAFGGPTHIALAGSDGLVRVNASGNANLETLRRAYPLPLVDRVAGRTDWQLTADIRPEALTWAIDAPMKGATIDLPAPLGKRADSTLPVRVERRALNSRGDRDTLVLDVRNTARLSILRRLPAGGDVVIERALALVGKATEQAGDAARAGLWIRAVVPDVDLDAWLTVRAAEGAGSGNAPGNAPGNTLALNGIDLNAGVATTMGRAFRNVTLTARSDGENWKLVMAGSDLEGSAQWQAPTPALPNGRLVARMARLVLPQAASDAAALDPPGEANPVDNVNRWPELDIDAARLVSKGHELGRLELRAQPSGSDWLIEALNVTNDSGKLTATGRWRIDDKHQHTEVKVALDTHDAGAFLARFGFPETLRAAPTQIEGTLSWAGAPSEFDYPTLAGTLRLHTGAGQFTKIDPGIGKLLGVLSLQALPRRLTLDFRDVFSEGFAFDEANGNVRIANGVLHTDDFVIVGPAARVTIRGDADLAQETQQLNVRVQPSLATSVSAGTAGAAMLLLAANPIVAAVVGAGTLLAQKVLQDPIESMFSYEYRVTGGWNDPVVARVDKAKALQDAAAVPAPDASNPMRR